ncbi:hypothetical protein [Variovorax sp. PBL-E5]|uniref:hypothetical protein n=1 Tax=Variovorax sp. PBL-E5 TaxID=434014 RepID=UPI0013A567E9|nr:hypothetical protein [Variovorax sp. PBL-E5]
MQRLLDYALKKTRDEMHPVVDQASLRERMGASAGAFTNWKMRGLSKDAAIAAEAEFGCSVNWLLAGAGDDDSKISVPAHTKSSASATLSPASLSLDQLLFQLGEAIESVGDPGARHSAATMLATFIGDPSGNTDMVPLIVKRLQRQHTSPITGPTIGGTGYQKQTPVVPFNPAGARSAKPAKGKKES